MKALAAKGQEFVRELLCLCLSIATTLAWPRVCWSVFLGMTAKLSLMVTFLIIVKLTSAYVLGEDNILSSPNMGTFLMFFIPAALFLSGSSLYFDMHFKIHYEHRFVRKMRKLHIQRFLAQDEHFGKDQLVQFIDQDDRTLFRAAINTFYAFFELSQSILIIAIIVSYLLYADWVVASLLLLALLIATPLFVYFGKSKQTGTFVAAEKGKEALRENKKDFYLQADNSLPVAVVAKSLNSILFGAEASAIKKEEDQRKLDARKPFPFIYGFIGLMFVILVYASLSGTDGNISAEQFGSWVIIFFALRFMAGAVQSLRNALFLLFSNYDHIRRINALLR